MNREKSIREMTDRELRIYKRRVKRKQAFRRKCMMVLMTFCLIVVCAVSYHSINSSANTGDEISFKYYTNITVSHGETLWEIADNYMDYDHYESKTDYIAEVRSINHLDENANIKVGQYLVLPYYSNEFIN